jgi:hypothetical protein
MTRQPSLTPVLHRNTANALKTSRVVVALGNGPHAQPIHEAFRQQGWEVHVANSACEVQRLVYEVRPRASILCTEPANRESGWLTCKKLVMAKPALRVVLVTNAPTDADRRLADFVGASACVGANSVAAVIRAATGVDVPSLN